MTVTHLEVLVEEASMERTLKHLLPRILGDLTFDIRTFNGKADLLRKLPERLHGYSRWFSGSERILVIVDRDDDDCVAPKSRLNDSAREAGLSVCHVAAHEVGVVLNRIAVEELEAWFFGDVEALRRAYPRVAESLASKRKFRDPDAISGGTWESMQKVLGDVGYHSGGLAKLKLAEDIGPHLSIAKNRSASFQTFVSGLRFLTERDASAA